MNVQLAQQSAAHTSRKHCNSSSTSISRNTNNNMNTTVNTQSQQQQQQQPANNRTMSTAATSTPTLSHRTQSPAIVPPPTASTTTAACTATTTPMRSARTPSPDGTQDYDVTRMREDDFERLAVYIVPDVQCERGIANRADRTLPRSLTLKPSMVFSTPNVKVSEREPTSNIYIFVFIDFK